MSSAVGPGSATETEPAQLDTLLSAYLRCLDEAERVPAFSAWGYLRFVFQLWLWEMAFTALFVAPFFDLLLFAMRPFIAWRPSGLTRRVARYLGRPFRGIWRGDISGLQMVRIGMLTRTFVGAHIVGNIERLRLQSDRQRLETLLTGEARPDTMSEADQTKLEALGNLAKATNAFGAILATGSASALPLALAKLLIPLLIQYAPKEFNDRVGRLLPLGQVLKTIGLSGDESLPASPTIVAIAGGFLCFLLLTAMSCHIEKRRIVRETGTLALEDAVLRAAGLQRMELPLDALFAAGAAAAGLLTMYLYSALALAEPLRSDQMSTALIDLLFCLALAAVVVLRRWWLSLACVPSAEKLPSTLLRSARLRPRPRLIHTQYK